MSKYNFTPQALDDLFDIWAFVVRDNLEAANRVEQAIYAACEGLAESPLAGSVREDLTSRPVRFWLVQPYTNYLVVYDPAAKPISIVRILHGARYVPAILT